MKGYLGRRNQAEGEKWRRGQWKVMGEGRIGSRYNVCMCENVIMKSIILYHKNVIVKK
jgi:hypothetical protein